MKKLDISNLKLSRSTKAVVMDSFDDVLGHKGILAKSSEKISQGYHRLKPKKGFASFFHIGLTVLLPFVLYTLVRIDFTQLAILLVLISKWRMFSVRARHWPANIRANAVDILVGLSTVLFMTKTLSQGLQFVWAILYVIWLVVLKPKSTVFWVVAQAMVGQLMALMALFLVYGGANISLLVFATAVVCYLSARHFFTAFSETFGRTTSYVWAYFAASVTWILAHWLIFYGVVAQPTLILSLVGYMLATLYYLQNNDRLSRNVQRQLVAVLTAVLIFVVVFSDWADKAV